MRQLTLTVGGRITVWLDSSRTGLDLTKQENTYVEITESKPIKLETSSTVIFIPMATVLWIHN